MTLIHGFSLQGYRSFSSDRPAVLLPLSKINLIAGQNNSGKSNVLRVIANTYSHVAVTTAYWDRPLDDSEHSFLRREFHVIDDIFKWPRIIGLQTQLLADLGKVLRDPGIMVESQGFQGVWIDVNNKAEADDAGLKRMAQNVSSYNASRALSQRLTNTTGGQSWGDAYRVLEWVFASKPASPHAFTIDGVRAISDDSDETPDLNGGSIKRRLLELQNPSTLRLDDKALFAKVQNFVRAVLDDPSITIDVPHDLSTIHITQAGRTLPIENMGTGIHEVVIIAAAATVTQNSILCIEEPEVHLHPILQRKLLRYLQSSTTNQYFIATHSAHMLDSALGSIFHVSRVNGISSIAYAGAARDRAAICADLGYRPSDLVQTNAVLWVEGPSDRIYLKHWIEQLAPNEFVEGTHYSVMFYGGALLSALSPLDSEEVEEFISLRNLNRYMVVLMDSDRKKPRDVLNESKLRVIRDLDEDPSTGFAWVTAGYTIENYVPEAVLTAGIQAAHRSTIKRDLPPQYKWANPLASERLGIQQPSKVAVAKSAIGEWGNEWPFDLKKQVERVVSLIRDANSHT